MRRSPFQVQATIDVLQGSSRERIAESKRVGGGRKGGAVPQKEEAMRDKGDALAGVIPAFTWQGSLKLTKGREEETERIQ